METQPRQAPKREGCKEAILALLKQHGGEMPVKELDAEMEEMGYSYRTLRRAKEEMRKNRSIQLRAKTEGTSRCWFVALCDGMVTPT